MITNSNKLLGFLFLLTILHFFGCKNSTPEKENQFQIIENKEEETLSIVRKGAEKAIITQNAKTGMRPYLHPIMSPDGNSELTQYSPGHHKHQTGLYWGFTRVNGTGAPVDTLKKWFYNREKPQRIKDQIGRDFFHFNGETHWQRIALNIVTAEGSKVAWQTVYQMLDAAGNPILEETKNWSMEEKEGKFLISLEWNGKAIEEITINEFSYGGMFLRMPWKQDIQGEAINSNGEKNEAAEGQKATWVDVGMEIEGRNDWGHIAIFDHSKNPSYPTPWRVDGQLGIGPCRAIEGDWNIKKGETETFQHLIVAYTGEFKEEDIKGIGEEFGEN